MKATYQDLINFCNNVGWDKGIQVLETIVFRDEILQASLFAGNLLQRKQATNMSKTIIQKIKTIAKLKQYRKDNNL